MRELDPTEVTKLALITRSLISQLKQNAPKSSIMNFKQESTNKGGVRVSYVVKKGVNPDPPVSSPRRLDGYTTVIYSDKEFDVVASGLSPSQMQGPDSNNATKLTIYHYKK
jgi:hypothetical protein